MRWARPPASPGSVSGRGACPTRRSEGLMVDLLPLGDRAFLARFALEAEARRWAGAVRSRAIPGVVDVAVAYASAAVFADPERLDPDELEAILRRLEPVEAAEEDGRLIRLPVLYDGE